MQNRQRNECSPWSGRSRAPSASSCFGFEPASTRRRLQVACASCTNVRTHQSWVVMRRCWGTTSEKLINSKFFCSSGPNSAAGPVLQFGPADPTLVPTSCDCPPGFTVLAEAPKPCLIQRCHVYTCHLELPSCTSVGWAILKTRAACVAGAHVAACVSVRSATDAHISRYMPHGA